MFRPKLIGSKSITPAAGGGSVDPFKLDVIPRSAGLHDLYRVVSLMLHFRFDLTTGASTGAISLRQLMEFLSSIVLRVGGHVVCNQNAYEIALINGGECGKLQHQMPAALGAGLTNEIRHLIVPLNFVPNWAEDPDDFAQLADLFQRDSELTINHTSTTIGTLGTVNAFKVALHASLARSVNPEPAAMPEYFSTLCKAQDTLPDAVYSYLAIMPATTFGATDITTVSLDAGGEAVLPAVGPDYLLDAYNRDNIGAASQQTAADAVVVPNYTDAYATLGMLPLLWPSFQRNKATGWVDTMNAALGLDLRGALTTPRLIGKRYKGLTQSYIKAGFEVAGIDPQSIEVGHATSNGKEITVDQLRTNRPGLRILRPKISRVKDIEKVGRFRSLLNIKAK